MVALSWSTAVPQRTTVTPAHLPRTEGKVEEKVAASEKKFQELESIKLSDSKAYTYVETATATATKTPVVEPAKAQAIASTSLFNFGKIGGEHIANVIALFNPSGIATAGGLKKPEGNSGSGDKKDGQNTFVAWHKGLEELREEKLLGTDNSFNVMA